MTGRVFPWIYDAVMRAAERGALARWRRSVVRPARGRIIEIGAGTGLNFPHYQAGAMVIATEPDLQMLARARPRAEHAGARIILAAADAEALPFRERTFDTAVVGFALCTIARPERALAELRRVLRPSGALRLLEHVRVAHPVGAKLQDWLIPVWRRVAGGCHVNRRTVEAVAASGFVLGGVRSHARGVVAEIAAHAPRATATTRRRPGALVSRRAD